MLLTGQRWRGWQGCVPSGDSGGGSYPCLLQLLEATCIPWLVIPFLHLQGQQWGTGVKSFSHCGTLTSFFFLPISSIFKYPMILLGHRKTQDNLLILESAVGARVMPPPQDIHIPDMDFNESRHILVYMAKGS